MRATLSFTSILLAGMAFSQGLYQAVKDPDPIGTQFEKYTTKDAFDRKITFYLSRGDDKQKLPLILFITGSGGQSMWIKKDGKLYGGLQNLLQNTAKGKARVLVVEKPGVEFAFQPPHPGAAEGCPKEFLEEHTLDRWAEANRAALKASLALEGVSKERVLVAGHSEGGIVAAKIAADNPEVTHVANMAGGGPSQLYDFTVSYPPDQIYSMWANVQKDPMSTEKFLFGHPYRRWSTFCAASPMEFLARFKGRIYVVQGTLDKAVPVQSFDILVADLRGRGKDLTAVRVDNGDHGFQVQNDKDSGFPLQFTKLVDWFLTPH